MFTWCISLSGMKNRLICDDDGWIDGMGLLSHQHSGAIYESCMVNDIRLMCKEY